MSTAAPTQADRPLQVTTPLGNDALLLTGFTGSEGISQLFHFHLDLLAPVGQEIAFHKLLGQQATVRLALGGRGARYFNGIISRVGQGMSDNRFTSYQVEMVPRLWLLTNRAQCRIFQDLSVPDILRKVLAGFDVDYKIHDTFHPREYCVQYRETDFNFISRLMEEEGIYYFFKHTADGHKMVLANTPYDHPAVPEPSGIPLDGRGDAPPVGGSIYSWEKVQHLRPSKYTLFDNHFQLPRRHLEADQTIVAEVQAGADHHPFKLPVNQELEIYDYPGEYAQRFDGVDRGGGDQPSHVKWIFEENARTAKIRMEQEAVAGLAIHGASDCRHFVSGHQFVLKGNASAGGPYVLTGISHFARTIGYQSDGGEFSYHNSFSCIPLSLPYRPPLRAPRPAIQGTQTAVVVGPPSEEIYTDKYGRVKVQFPWDRQGGYNADSSCWVRVAQVWAGKRWGASFWPRIGQEVVVAFEEGNPDRPIIVGSVYNEEQRPPYLGDGPDPRHDNDNRISGIKTNTTPEGSGFNELRFDDAKGKEQVFIHAERNLDCRVKSTCRETVGGSRHLIVGSDNDGQPAGDLHELVYKDRHVKVKGNQEEQIGGSMRLLIGGEADGNQDVVIKGIRKELVDKDSHCHVKGNRNEKVDGAQSLTVGGSQQEKVGQDHALEAGQAIHIKAGMTLVLEAGTQLTLKVGGNFIDISPAGIAISGTPTVLINSGGAAGSGAGSTPAAPEEAKEANPTVPNAADDARSGWKSAP